MRAASAMVLTFIVGCVGGMGCANASAATGDAPECAVARVGEDVVTVKDADVVRAVVQPGLTRGEAKRLAVAATAAYRQQNPQGSMADMGARLAAYREAVRRKADLSALEKGVLPGACWGG
jgi:hypothetical protein